MSTYIEKYLSQVQYEGALRTQKPIVTESTLAVTGAAVFSSTVSAGALSGTTTSITGAATMKSGTAVPATAGAVAAGAPIVLNSNGITIECTTDVPTHNRPIGSICINLGGTTTNNRMYIATSAAGAWTAFTTAA